MPTVTMLSTPLDNVFVAQHMQYDPNADLNGDAKVTPLDLQIVMTIEINKEMNYPRDSRPQRLHCFTNLK